LYQEEDQSRKIKILKQMGLKDEDMKRIDAIHTESKDIVKADFEQLGSLIENKAIPKKDFLRMYWHDVLKCWTVLNQAITKFRDQTKDNNHMINFEKLYNYSTPFKKTKQLQVKDLFIHPEVNYATPLLATPDSQKYKIRIGFDIQIEESSISDSLIKIFDISDHEVEIPYEWSWDHVSNAVILELETRPLCVKLCISDQIQDKYGMSMESCYSKTISFVSS